MGKAFLPKFKVSEKFDSKNNYFSYWFCLGIDRNNLEENEEEKGQPRKDSLNNSQILKNYEREEEKSMKKILSDQNLIKEEADTR